MEVRTKVVNFITYNVLWLGVCYFALQILQVLDKINRQNNSTKPLLYEVGIVYQNVDLEHEKKFKIKALGGLVKPTKK